MKSLIAIFKDSEIDNYYVVLNNAINTDKDFFTPFDIKNIIKTNIDYTIGQQFHMNNIDHYVINGEIPILNKKVKSQKKKEVEKFLKIAKRLIGKDGDIND